jgi:hypothetical protein
MALVLPELEEREIDAGDVLVAGMIGWEYEPYLEGRQTLDAGDPDIVAVATKESLRFPIDPAVTALLDAEAGAYEKVVVDDVTLYILDDRAAASG